MILELDRSKPAGVDADGFINGRLVAKLGYVL